MTTGNDETQTWVLRLDVVRWGIEELARIRAHPFFIAYLHLRARSLIEDSDSGIRPYWNKLGDYLEVPGGPPRKPYYRPLFDPPGNPSRYWLNENLAGSFAPSSLREGMPPMQVVRKERGGMLSLRPNHEELAFHHLLYEKHLNVYPLAAFLYRDYGLIVSQAEEAGLGPDSLVEVFKQDWMFRGSITSQIGYNALFIEGSLFPGAWFERLNGGASWLCVQKIGCGILPRTIWESAQSGQ